MAAIALGAAAVILGVVATAIEPTTARAHPHREPVPHEASPVPTPVVFGATTAPAAVTAPTRAELAGVEWGADGVLRIGGHVIVNKTFPLPPEFGPGALDPAAAAAFEQMRQAAAADGVPLWIVSGYRSHAHQGDNYAERVAQAGVEQADRGMARAGHSEHQTGLAIDVNDLTTAFGQTPAGQWVATNAHRFGFVVRYPDGKEAVTGFKYEPWHLRYLDVDLATTLFTSGLTIEEYFGLSSQY